LERGDLETSTAPLVLAIDGIVDSHEVRLGFGELHAVFLAGVRGAEMPSSCGVAIGLRSCPIAGKTDS
jgi:hypothetical protein